MRALFGLRRATSSGEATRQTARPNKQFLKRRVFEAHLRLMPAIALQRTTRLSREPELIG
jgi:hypothetical protein